MSNVLWLNGRARQKMLAYANASFPLETGGMLLGYEANNGEAVVTSIIGPGPHARHFRDRFVPDAEYQQAELEAHYTRTNGGETYLGDWHTHPDGESDLSNRDKRTLHHIATTPASGTANPVMLIMAGDVRDWIIGAVRYVGFYRRFLFRRYDLTTLSVVIYEREVGM